MSITKVQTNLFSGSDIGPDYVEKEVRRVQTMPPIIKLLQFIGYTGIATGVQLYRFLRRDYTENKSYELIAHAIRKRYICPFTIPGQSQDATALFYFAERGFKYLRSIDRDIADTSRFGVPDKKRMNQAHHDLIIMGSLIKWREEHEIIWFMSDKQMRQDRMRQRWQYWKHNIGSELPSEAIGDYKICLYKLSDGKVNIHECESSVKYRAEVIDGKPKFMKWFAANRYQQKKINLITGTMPEIIEPFTLHDEIDEDANAYIRSTIQFNRSKNNAEGFTLLDRNLLDFIKSTQMVLSTDDLMQMFPDNYRNITRSLTKLERKGFLKSDVGKLLYGTGRGRPNKYYYLKENDGLISDVNAFQRHIILSFIFCRGAKQKEWRFLEYDKNVPALTAEIDGEPLTFISDHSNGETFKVTVRTVNEFFKFKANSLYKVKLVVLDYDRKTRLEKEIPADNLYDLSSHFIKIKTNR
jgi:hypothetical protein